MSLNILVDRHHTPNIYQSTTDPFFLNYWNPRIRELIPRELAHLPDINIITADKLDEVDWFIYPVILNEPFFFVREFMFPDHPYGFWRRVNPDIKKRIDAGKGIVYVAMNSEPVDKYDLQALVDSFKATDEKRIVFNIHHSKYIDDGFLSYPGWMEDFEFTTLQIKHFLDTKDGTIMLKNPKKKKYFLANGRYEKHAGAILITSLLDQHDLFKMGYVYVDKPKEITELFEKVKIQMMPDTNLIGHTVPKLHKANDLATSPFCLSQIMKCSYFNLVVEAYYSDYMIDYPLITEKIWRNVVNRKPFVCVGQKGTLKQLHDWGYKTFHPFIDEQYDNLDDDNRIYAAFEQVKKLCSMSDNELSTLCLEFEHIHDHNINNFYRRSEDLGKHLRQLKA